MSESPAGPARFLLPVLGVLSVIAALFAGWLVAQAPVPAARPAAATAGFGASPGQHAPVISQWTTIASATEESGRNGKPILIDFNAEWCGPCQALKHEVFDDDARGRAVQAAVIPVSIVDRQREEGNNSPETRALQQRYNVEAFPTLVVYSPATGRMVTTRGFGDAGRTLQWITEAAKYVR